MKAHLLCTVIAAVVTSPLAAQQAAPLDATIAALAQLDKPVLTADAPERKLREMRDAANRSDREAWATIDSKAAWEQYRDARIELLRRSLGQFPEAPGKIKVLTTKAIDGDGFRVENLVYESRPGLVVTANLYVPATPRAAMPGIVIIHSHHNPKTQGELQDMGMTWARAGCLVLVPDMLGHGERRQHPFAGAKDYAAPFKVGRQDYFFRYNLGVQLQLVGESLIGWMAWDLMRGIDVLLARPGIARDKIIVLGSVAGGGDPAAVLAALDKRVAAVVPFNFGGAQPETKFPLPPDAELSFNYMGGGSWESTRNLRNSARDGFLPWLIVAAAAPRPLIYAHEFAWDRERDPVWKRLQKVYGFYGAEDKLASVHGRGAVTGKPPEATHCNNIGLAHRKGIHPAFEKWFGIKATEYSKRLPSAELQCMTAEATKTFKPQPAWLLAHTLAQERVAAASARRAKLGPKQQRPALQHELETLLGVPALHNARTERVSQGKLAGATFETQVLRHSGEPSLAVPLLLLRPVSAAKGTPAVIAIAQRGKSGFLKSRAEIIARLLQSGVSVCLADLRNTGEMRPKEAGRGRTSGATGVSATELMHGKTIVGRQVQELLLVIEALRAQGAGPIVLWGDSFAPVNAADANLAVPHDAEGPQPKLGKPMGGLVALLAGILAPDDTVRALYLRGSLVRYRSALASPFIYLPHDACVPGMLTVADTGKIMAAWAPRALRFDAAIDARNQRVGREAGSAEEVAQWLVKAAQGAGR